MTIHEQYKTYHNQIVELTKASKSNYFQKFFYENKENSQNMWKGINELIGKSNEKRNPEIHFQYCEWADKWLENCVRNITNILLIHLII